MLNKVILMGRITHDLELKQISNGSSVLSFSIAVEQNFKSQNGERQTDFINCVAWRQQAESIARYFSKGRMICIEGNLRTRNYDDKNGVKHYVTEVYVDSFYFTGEAKQQGQGNGQYANNYGNGGYQNNNGYQNNGYQNNGGYSQEPSNGGYQQQNNYNNNSAPSNDELAIGDLADFEEVIGDDKNLPF